MNEPVVAFDLGRMLLGDEPPLFLLEIGLRTIIIYVYTLTLIRWIGSRSIAQLSLVEFLLVIALGSAVGDAMFYPDVPLIHCMIVITVVVLLDKALSYLVSRHPRLEDTIEGKSIEVVRDGVIQCRTLEDVNFGHDELFEQLRLKGIAQLGQVRSAYLETNGMVSVFKTPDDAIQPGLPIEPPWDVSPPKKIKAGEMSAAEVACANCAGVLEDNTASELPQCPRCGSDTWHEAAR